MTKLEKGIYRIICARDYHLPHPRYVGRYPHENIDMTPKQIYNLPAGVYPHHPQWLVDPVDDGTYILRALSAEVGPLDDNVAAFISPPIVPWKWKVTPVESTKNPNDYIVQLPRNDHGLGWTLGEKTHQGEKIILKPVVAHESQPPKYLPTQVFNFLRVDKE